MAELDVRAAPDLAARARAIQQWSQAKTKSAAPSLPWRISTKDLTWLRDRRLLIGVGVAVCLAISLVSIHFFEKSGLLGFGYFLLRFALLGAGLAYLEREGPMSTLAAGAVTGSTVYFMVDAFSSISSDANALTWLELLAVAAFIALLWVRFSPIQRLPRRLRMVPPGSQRAAFAIVGGLLAWFVLLFVGVQYDTEYGFTFTLVSQVGVLATFIPVLTIGTLCAAVALLELDESQGLFASAATAAYFIPEAILLLGSLALGDQFAYYSDGFWAGFSVPWFTIAQAVVALTLATGTLIGVRGRPALRDIR